MGAARRLALPAPRARRGGRRSEHRHQRRLLRYLSLGLLQEETPRPRRRRKRRGGLPPDLGAERLGRAPIERRRPTPPAVQLRQARRARRIQRPRVAAARRRRRRYQKSPHERPGHAVQDAVARHRFAGLLLRLYFDGGYVAADGHVRSESFIGRAGGPAPRVRVWRPRGSGFVRAGPLRAHGRGRAARRLHARGAHGHGADDRGDGRCRRHRAVDALLHHRRRRRVRGHGALRRGVATHASDPVPRRQGPRPGVQAHHGGRALRAVVAFGRHLVGRRRRGRARGRQTQVARPLSRRGRGRAPHRRGASATSRTKIEGRRGGVGGAGQEGRRLKKSASGSGDASARGQGDGQKSRAEAPPFRERV
mmetsp:Transcript_1749/g.4937  ORF Transcript_1749/g.4937 Transcript_1749/m.4937 type:complete len:365 (+) Transcript_1749:1126-2220(+)